MASSLPTTLDERTVANLISTLDRTLYPEPTAGFTARTAILIALTALSMLLVLLYLYLHYRSSSEGVRCLWFMRLIDRPSGRFLVINPRLAWVGTVLLYGSYELVILGVFWQTYSLGRGQKAWLALRTFDAMVLALGGWIISWAGLTAFLVAVDSERHCVSARTANFLFIGGGLTLIGVQTALATAVTVLLERFWDRYLELRGALVRLDRSLDGKAPTLLDFVPLRDPAEAFAAAAGPARTASLVQFAFIIVFPLSILAVNFGGLALVRRLRHQLNESAEFDASAIEIDLDRNATMVSSGGLGPRPAPALEVASPSSSGFGVRDAQLAVSVAPEGGNDGVHVKAHHQLDARAVRILDRRGGTSAARAQTRRLLVLQKAMRDLQMTAWHIGFVSTCLLATTIWLLYCAVTDRTTSGEWAYIEGTAMPAQWIYSVAVVVSLFFLIYNQLASRRRLVGLEKGDDSNAVTPPKLHVTMPASGRSTPGSSPLDSTRSATRSRSQGEVENPAKDAFEKHLLGIGDDDGAPAPARPPSDADMTRRPTLRKKSWASIASRDSGEGGGPAWRLSWPARAVPPRMASAAASVFVTVETSQVCDDGAVGQSLAAREENLGSGLFGGGIERA
ncbi:hypothetical protein JCM3775_004392 [Rhodotorula graminis]